MYKKIAIKVHIQKSSALLQKTQKLCEVVGDKTVVRTVIPRQPPVNVGNGAV